MRQEHAVLLLPHLQRLQQGPLGCCVWPFSAICRFRAMLACMLCWLLVK